VLLISNGSFYWISANVPARSFAGWIENLGDWYRAFMQTTLAYVAVAAIVHGLSVQFLRWMPADANNKQRR
jgi:hypothetical protein